MSEKLKPPVKEIKNAITGVEIIKSRSGIPLKGIKDVESALKIFASGATRESMNTKGRNINAIRGSSETFYSIPDPIISSPF